MPFRVESSLTWGHAGVLFRLRARPHIGSQHLSSIPSSWKWSPPAPPSTPSSTSPPGSETGAGATSARGLQPSQLRSGQAQKPATDKSLLACRTIAVHATGWHCVKVCALRPCSSPAMIRLAVVRACARSGRTPLAHRLPRNRRTPMALRFQIRSHSETMLLRVEVGSFTSRLPLPGRATLAT